MLSSISIELAHKIYVPIRLEVRVQSRNGLVYCLLGQKVVEFRTPAAHKAGFALVKKSSEAQVGDVVEMTINNQTIDLLPPHAKRLGGMLLRKADDADDFQLRISQ